MTIIHPFPGVETLPVMPYIDDDEELDGDEEE
jgi:hypothetical protein